MKIMIFMLFSLVPADSAFSSVTITDVTPTELHPGDTKEAQLGRDEDVELRAVIENSGEAAAKDAIQREMH